MQQIMFILMKGLEKGYRFKKNVPLLERWASADSVKQTLINWTPKVLQLTILGSQFPNPG